MPIVSESVFKKNISGIPSGVYLLFGDDGYLKKEYSKKIAEKIASPEDVFNYNRFYGECDLQDVYDSVLQLPIMSDKRYVELCDYDFEKCSKTDFERLCSLIEEVPDETVFVIRFDCFDFDPKKSSRFKKITASVSKANGLAVNLEHRKLPELIKMLTDGAAKRGVKLETNAARLLVETAGNDIEILRNEFNKLCSYADNGVITEETVDRVSIKTVEASVYNLYKHILAADTTKALVCLDEIFYMRIEPMVILYSISSAYVDIFRLYTAKQEGLGVSCVAEAFGYKGREFILEKSLSYLRKFDLKRLDLSFRALRDADKSLKSTGANERVILEQLIIRLIYILVKGESVD